MRLRALAIALALAALCAAPADALAHSLSPPSPLSGDGGTAFTFYGRAWQSSQVIQAQYYRRFNDSRPWRTKNFRTSTSGTGSFAFRLLDPFAFSSGMQQRMCFAQYDTRYGRVYRKCASFYIEPPRAYFMPPDGVAGTEFILVAQGFQAGRTLLIQLTTPLGDVQNYTTRTRTRAKFIVTGFGPVFIPRGGAIREFQSNTTDPLGLYSALVQQPDAPAHARAVVAIGAGG